MSKRAQIHHYVPQHLIDNFAGNEKGQVCVFDKREERFFWTNPKNICAENGYNDFQFEEWIVSFEEAVTKFEDIYQPVIRKILSEGNLNLLGSEDYEIIRLFLAFQFLRTKFMRKQFDDLQKVMKDRVVEVTRETKIDENPELADENQIKQFYLSSLFEDTEKFAGLLAGRDIFLIEACEGTEYIIGDHPVVLHNLKDMGPYGNIGWAITGIQIYIPISPKYALACWCRSIIDEHKVERDNAVRSLLNFSMRLNVSFEAAVQRSGNSYSEHQDSIKQINDLIAGVRKQKYLYGDKNNTDFINSQQVIFSVRYLMAKSNNFDLVKRMIGDDLAFKSAIKPTIS